MCWFLFIHIPTLYFGVCVDHEIYRNVENKALSVIIRKREQSRQRSEEAEEAEEAEKTQGKNTVNDECVICTKSSYWHCAFARNKKFIRRSVRGKCHDHYSDGPGNRSYRLKLKINHKIFEIFLDGGAYSQKYTAIRNDVGAYQNHHKLCFVCLSINYSIPLSVRYRSHLHLPFSVSLCVPISFC